MDRVLAFCQNIVYGLIHIHFWSAIELLFSHKDRKFVDLANISLYFKNLTKNTHKYTIGC